MGTFFCKRLPFWIIADVIQTERLSSGYDHNLRVVYSYRTSDDLDGRNVFKRTINSTNYRKLNLKIYTKKSTKYL